MPDRPSEPEEFVEDQDERVVVLVVVVFRVLRGRRL
jgi:hypothetical protein